MKTGTVREDGMIYYSYGKQRGVWLTKSNFERKRKRVRDYQRNSYKLYKEVRKRAWKFGEYNPEKNLYFCGVTVSGKEIWRSKECMLSKKKYRAFYQKKHIKKCKELPPTNLKVGDQHPDNPKLFVVYKIGNKPYFGTKKKLEKRRNKLREMYARRDQRYRLKKNKKLRNNEKIYKKGDVHPQTKLIFWNYTRSFYETWLTPEDFKLRQEKKELLKKHTNKTNIPHLSLPNSP